MNAMQVTDTFLGLIDDALRADIIDTPLIGLFTGAPSLSVATVLADLTALAPTFTGYAPTATTVEAKRKNSAGDYILGLTPVLFQPTAPTTGLPVTVTGYYLSSLVGVPRLLFGAEFLDTPFTFADEFSAMSVSVDLMVKNLTVWGGLCSVC